MCFLERFFISAFKRHTMSLKGKKTALKAKKFEVKAYSVLNVLLLAYTCLS